MSRFYYDLHLHSCLSPCGDNDSTPSNIAGMGMLAGLSIMALTDHNSTRNCPAFYEAAKRVGVVPVAGMELETAENIHIVCLFETLDGAMRFGEIVNGRRIPIKNKASLYGDQIIVDCEDNELERDPILLVVATTIALSEVPDLVKSCGGVCYPAHVDRPSGGIIAVLGDIPPDVPFVCAELHDISRSDELKGNYPSLSEKLILTGSDAHRLEDIRDASEYLDLDASPDDHDAVRRELFRYLRGEKN